MNPFNPYLNSINRKEDDPLNILTFSTHEGFQTCMSETKDRYTHIPSPEGKTWNTEYRKMPKNIIEIDKMGKAKNIDLIISHTTSQANMAEKIKGTFGVKHISMNHIFPNEKWPDRVIRSIKENNTSDITVFTTAEQRQLWGYSDKEAIVIPHGIECIKYSGYKRLNYRVLTCANFYKERGDELGYDMYQKIKQLINDNSMFFHVGTSNDGSSKAYPEQNLIKIYQREGMFLNTATRSVLPTSLLEAMSVGMPVISSRNETIDKLINNGVNGFLYNTAEEAMFAIEVILNEKDFSIRMGLNARDTIKKHYNIDGFVKNWKNTYKGAIKI